MLFNFPAAHLNPPPSGHQRITLIKDSAGNDRMGIDDDTFRMVYPFDTYIYVFMTVPVIFRIDDKLHIIL